MGYELDPKTNKMVRDNRVKLPEWEKNSNMETWNEISKKFFNAFRNYDEWLDLLVEKDSKDVGTRRWSDYYRIYATAVSFSDSYVLNEREKQYNDIIRANETRTNELSKREDKWKDLQERAKAYNLDIKKINEFIIEAKKNQENLDKRTDIKKVEYDQKLTNKEIEEIVKANDTLKKMENKNEEIDNEL